MLLLAHAGITLGVTKLLNTAISRNHASTTISQNVKGPLPSASATAQSSTETRKTLWLSALVNHIDVRILLIGSMLPDIVDKPIGLYLFRDTFSTGRLFCHTLLFFILITLAGVYLWKVRGKVWLLVLAFGTFTHLILDQMWLAYRTFLWPFFGFTFEREDVTDWAAKMLRALHTNPSVYLPEFIGAVVLIWFVLVLLRKKKICSFIKNGKVL